MIQTISCRTCGKTFAACTEPECYTDDEWIADVKKYVKAGHVVKMVEPGTWSLEGCDCDKTHQP